MPLPANRPSAPLLCYVTDRGSLAPAASPLETLLMRIDAAIAAGVDWIQIREKDLSGGECAALTRAALSNASQSASLKGNTVKILVNDRLDLALAESAHGVHLGERSLPIHEARKLADEPRPSSNSPFLIGASCHTLAEAQAAEAAEADYVIFGPIFETPSKVGFGPPQGLDHLARICEAVSIPVLAIGGMTLLNAPSCLAAGAKGIAAIRLFQDASDGLPSLVRALHALPLRHACRPVNLTLPQKS